MNLKGKWTPGPWTLDQSRMVLGPCFTGELKSICDKVRGGSPEQAQANARLIAAAPRMIHALQLAARVLAERLDQDAALVGLRTEIVETIKQATPEYYGLATEAAQS